MPGGPGVQVADGNLQINQYFSVDGQLIEQMRAVAGRRPQGWRVFVSHTSELSEYPASGSFVAAARSAIARAGHAVMEMGSWTAAPASPEQTCRDRLRECDVFVGVVGFRYGTIAGDEARSYTEGP
jgi:hypothetical protein